METAQKGCVYFIKLNGLSPIKIGYTTNESPQSRLDQIRTCAPLGVELVGFILSDNPYALERKLHDKYQHLRLHGEWFEITKEQVNSICNLYMHHDQRSEMAIIYEMYAKGMHLPEYGNKEKVVRVKVLTEREKWEANFPKNMLAFLDKLSLDLDVRYDKTKILSNFNRLYGNTGLSQRKVTQCFINYFTDKGYEIIEGKSDYRWVMITMQQPVKITL